MTAAHAEFGDRLKRIDKKNRKLSKGSKVVLNKSTGVAEEKPIRQLRLPIFPLLVVGLCFTGFKAFLLSGKGADAFSETVATLQSGTFVEQVGAFFMQIDPVTQTISEALSKLL